jgi:hypothetical protein
MSKHFQLGALRYIGRELHGRARTTLWVRIVVIAASILIGAAVMGGITEALTTAIHQRAVERTISTR